MKKTLTQITTDYRLITGYIITFILLLSSYFISLYTNRELVRQINSVTNTKTMIADLETLISLVKDGETGVRGFMNAKDSIYLEPYYKSIPAAQMLIKKLDSASRNESRRSELKKLEELIQKKWANIEFSINYFSTHNFSIDKTLLDTIYEGKGLMDNIRFTTSRIQNREQDLLEAKSQKLDSRYIALNIIIIVSLLLAFVFALFGIITFIRETRARKLAAQRIAEYQEELKQRVEELDQANKELKEMRREEKLASAGRIARIIGHEVRNPLTNIDLALNQLKEEIKGQTEESNMLFNIAKRNSERINQLVTALLNTTFISDLKFDRIPVNTLVDDSIALAGDRIELNKVKLEKSLIPEDIHVSADEEKIKTAFLNIIINAIEAMKAGGEGVLNIVTKREHNKCVVIIADNGVGIDEKSLSSLFEPYYTTKPKGTGLGLAHTHNILVSHKASIDVESKPGSGTRFIMKFDIV